MQKALKLMIWNRLLDNNWDWVFDNKNVDSQALLLNGTILNIFRNFVSNKYVRKILFGWMRISNEK